MSGLCRIKQAVFFGLLIVAAFTLRGDAKFSSGSVNSHTHANSGQGGNALAPMSVSATNSVTAPAITAAVVSSAPTVAASTFSFTAKPTPASPGAWKLWADSTLGKLAYSDGSGNIVTVDPEYNVVVSWFARSPLPPSAAGYTSVVHSSTAAYFSTTEGTVRYAFGMKGTMVAMDCNSATGGARTWTMRKNGSDTELSCSTTSTENCRDTGSVSIVATDEIVFYATGAYEGSSRPIYGCRFVFQPGVQ